MDICANNQLYCKIYEHSNSENRLTYLGDLCSMSVWKNGSGQLLLRHTSEYVDNKALEHPQIKLPV